jgi:uncharacterized protein (UPF0262 family)
MSKNHWLVDVKLEDVQGIRLKPEIEHERAVAIYDLLDGNSFEPDGGFEGPYKLRLSVRENRLYFDIRTEEDEHLVHVILPLKSFHEIVRDYFLCCESYFTAIKRESPSRIEALDMARRGMHNEGSEMLRHRLEGKIKLDFDTARRLFTLICVLHIRA